MPEPGNTITPNGAVSRNTSMRLKGRDVLETAPVWLSVTWGTLGLSVEQARSVRLSSRHRHGEGPVGMLGVDLIESVPNALMIDAIDSAGKGDPMSAGQTQLRLSQLLGV